MYSDGSGDALCARCYRLRGEPRQFRIGQRFEGQFTGAVREIVGITSYEVEQDLRYPDGRVTRIFSSKRSLREQIADGDLKEVVA